MASHSSSLRAGEGEAAAQPVGPRIPADASASIAGDFQLWRGGRVAEAYEVTANAWDTKIAQAAVVLRQNDLPRVHIVARGPAPSAEIIRQRVAATPLPAGLMPGNVDISVLDVQAECRSLLHRLSRPGRRGALQKLWEHLATKQSNDGLVGAYVAFLIDAGVVAES